MRTHPLCMARVKSPNACGSEALLARAREPSSADGICTSESGSSAADAAAADAVATVRAFFPALSCAVATSRRDRFFVEDDPWTAVERPPSPGSAAVPQRTRLARCLAGSFFFAKVGILRNTSPQPEMRAISAQSRRTATKTGRAVVTDDEWALIGRIEAPPPGSPPDAPLCRRAKRVSHAHGRLHSEACSEDVNASLRESKAACDPGCASR